MRIFIIILICSFGDFSSSAQGLAAFHDYRSYFIVFDHGMFWEAENLKVNDFKVTRHFVVYVSNDEKLKAFYGGKKKLITEYFDYYHVGEDFVVYEYAKHVYLFRSGITTEICDWCKADARDSILRVIKQPGSILEITLRDTTVEISREVETTTIRTYRMEKNMFSWTDAGYNLKLLWKNEIWDMGVDHPGKWQGGANILVWTDNFDQNFKCFYNGMIYDLESQIPKYSYTSDNTVAYLDYNGNFKIFYKGKTQQISQFEPTNLIARDNLVSYMMGNQFKVFYDGKEYELENYLPKSYGMIQSQLVYMDYYEKLAIFSAGELKRNLTTEKIRDLSLFHDVVLYTTGINTVNALWEGKAYVY
ncbi:MAG: hypothetical protein IT233_08290 [Bacteroidia bacterium]|nr:hypothetical protein [Bacteroidia bacterium]